jgi:hypothetical protein
VDKEHSMPVMPLFGLNMDYSSMKALDLVGSGGRLKRNRK